VATRKDPATTVGGVATIGDALRTLFGIEPAQTSNSMRDPIGRSAVVNPRKKKLIVVP
jgi:hypothetical protein